MDDHHHCRAVLYCSKSAVPLSTMIHQFSLEHCPSDDKINVQECMNSINDLLRSDELQRSDYVDAVNRVAKSENISK